MTQFNDATLRQIQAARPEVSTWLSANAGSGKTRVLTDRVARLLLQGVPPERVLCLTYTKAAASEMQNRLFKRLGAWAMKTDEALRKELVDLGVSQNLDSDALRRARTLFARAIEAPGGLKIQTIHSFCASLLRRFPLEAGVSPQFKEADEKLIAELASHILETMSQDSNRPVVERLIKHTGDHEIDKLLAAITQRRDQIRNMDTDTLHQVFGIDKNTSQNSITEYVFQADTLDLLHQFSQVLINAGGSSNTKTGLALASITEEKFAFLPMLESVFLYGKTAKSPFGPKIDSVGTKAVRAGPAVHLMPSLNDLMERVASCRDARLAVLACEKTRDLINFSKAFLPRYEREKQLRGWLDFDDLIFKARDLLSNPAVAEWVLFRLDGGIDHILVDEAQDTSPVQWKVIETLARELASGEGTRAIGERTLFVVGDQKQSIYSFQGADPDEFDRMRREFDARLKASPAPLETLTLEYSFRSSHAILNLVDHVFLGRGNSGFHSNQPHKAFHSTLPGRVDLWPVVEKTSDPEIEDWSSPVDKQAAKNHMVQLAENIADEIKHMIDHKVILPEKVDDNGTCVGRPVRPGDFLILVQRRSELFHEIIRACKANKLEIAGADRLKVGAEIAVRDLAALLSFLSLPEDDLSLAVVLKSPLFGWTEQKLFTLAHGRGRKYLWQVLRGDPDAYSHELSILNDLRDHADFLRPYDLLQRVLLRHGGRRKFVARLGAESEDGIDALLTQAMNFESAQIPSLTSFISWMETDDIEIKRQVDSASDQIRVMSVHGSKGLEAPIVILPDTAARKNDIKDQLLTGTDGVIWKPTSDTLPLAAEQMIETLKNRNASERDRLLYVALTRAEKWLIVAAAGDVNSDPPSWYSQIESGMHHVGASKIETRLGTGLRYEYGRWDDILANDPILETKEVLDKPTWLHEKASKVVSDAGPLSPSDLGGAKALAGDIGQDTETALRQGSQMHLLLEHLPNVPQVDWPTAARQVLESANLVMETQDQTVIDNAIRVLEIPDLAHLFSKDALHEVPLSGSIDALGGRTVYGVADCLLVDQNTVHVIDYKTNKLVPNTAENTPVGLLRQMGAYRALLENIFRNHNIKTSILWTETALLMEIPQDLVMSALASTNLDLSRSQP